MSHEERIDAVIEQLFSREELYAEKRFARAETEHTYRVRYSVEYNAGEGSIDARKAAAIITCAKELAARDVAAAESDIAYEKLQDARTVLSARQSLLKASMERGV